MLFSQQIKGSVLSFLCSRQQTTVTAPYNFHVSNSFSNRRTCQATVGVKMLKVYQELSWPLRFTHLFLMNDCNITVRYVMNEFSGLDDSHFAGRIQMKPDSKRKS